MLPLIPRRRRPLAGVALLALGAGAQAQNAPVTVTIDAQAGRHPISPAIYGVASASTAQLSALNSPLNRSGGNGATRYNWRANASNHAADWFFESIPETSAVPGESGDTFIANSKGAGAQPMLTIPMIGWVAKVGPNREKLASFSVAKYGPQEKTDQWMPDAGNGKKPDGKTDVTGNDPREAHVPSDPAFQKAWVQHLVAKWGTSAKGGLKYYLMDNEPSLWQSTHRDVHPTGPTMEEILDDIVSYGRMVKSVDPGALVVGPEEWGWNGYRLSGYDQQWGGVHGWNGPLPDQTKHGGMEYLPWLLDQLHRGNQLTGKRILDVFTVHIYPQGGEGGDAVDEKTQLLRNRSTRSLWDPDYKDESWINDKVMLIPRLKGWVAKYYPGTKIGVTEYNWGAENHISGATAQADILGIFGRENLDMATRWTTPDATTPTFKAMQMYRNYDGKKSGFGDVSVSDTVPNPDEVSSFAAVRSSDKALTVMVVNKSLHASAPATLSLAHFAAGAAAQAWQLTSANAVTPLAAIPVQGNTLRATLPAQSVTLFVIPAKI